MGRKRKWRCALEESAFESSTRSAAALDHVERNYRSAIEHFEQARGEPATLGILAYTHHLVGDDASSVEALVENSPAESEADIRSAFEQGGYLGVIRGVTEFLVQQSGKPCAYNPLQTASFLAIIGEADRMFECLDEALPLPLANYRDILNITGSDVYEPYRDDPRFIATVNRLVPEF